jgi:hypothetical protein
MTVKTRALEFLPQYPEAAYDDELREMLMELIEEDADVRRKATAIIVLGDMHGNDRQAMGLVMHVFRFAHGEVLRACIDFIFERTKIVAGVGEAFFKIMETKDTADIHLIWNQIASSVKRLGRFRDLHAQLPRGVTPKKELRKLFAPYLNRRG